MPLAQYLTKKSERWCTNWGYLITSVRFAGKMFTNLTHKVRIKKGLSNDIPVYRGIKQGWPLSPLLFNLVLEVIIPQIENSVGGCQFKGRSRVKILVYADDICLIGQEKYDIQRSLDMLTEFTNWAGVTFKISKGGSFTLINNKGRKYVEPYQPCIVRTPILGQLLIFGNKN